MNESNRSRRLVIQAGAGLAAAGAGLLVWQLKEPAAASATDRLVWNHRVTTVVAGTSPAKVWPTESRPYTA